MTVVYTACHESIGSFNDTEYIVHMLNRVCTFVNGLDIHDATSAVRRQG